MDFVPWSVLSPLHILNQLILQTDEVGAIIISIFADENPDIREAIGSSKFTQIEAKEQDTHTHTQSYHKPKKFCLSW